MSAPVINVHGLCKSYGGRNVVDGLTLQVARGEVCGFLGANGSGKTTTIRLLCGLLTPDSGGGTCLGFDLRRHAALIRCQVGYMTQRFSFYEDLTVSENLRFVARLYELTDHRQAVDDILERMGACPQGAAIGRISLRRLETAPGTGGLRFAQTKAAAARRTNSGRRCQRAACVLGSHSRSRR